MADVIHDKLLNEIDWNPTYINSLTASTPACIRTPIHYSSDKAALSAIAGTVGKTDLSEVTYCRIHNTLELIRFEVSQNLLSSLNSNAKAISAPYTIKFDANGDLPPLPVAEDEGDVEIPEHGSSPVESVRA
jgi:hypothetical protein